MFCNVLAENSALLCLGWEHGRGKEWGEAHWEQSHVSTRKLASHSLAPSVGKQWRSTRDVFPQAGQKICWDPQVGFWQTVKVFSAGCCKPLNFRGPFAKENHFPAAALIKNKDFQFIAGSKAGCHFIGLSDECASHAFLVRVSAMFSWILNNENIFLTHWTKISPATDPLLSRSPIFATVFLFPR